MIYPRDARGENLEADISQNAASSQQHSVRNRSSLRHLIARISVAVITFTLGVAAATIWIVHRFPRVDNAVTKSLPSDAHPDAPLSLCELTQNPERYTAKTVRLRAILIGFHELALYDPACNSEQRYIRADFDSAGRQKLIQAMASLDDAVFRQENFRADVILVGRFESIQDVKGRGEDEAAEVSNQRAIEYRFRLVVFEVEGAQAAAPDVPSYSDNAKAVSRVNSTTEEYNVYSALINSMYLRDGIRLIVIRDRTSIDSFDDNTSNDRMEFLNERLPALSQQTISDFKAKNRQPSPLHYVFKLSANVILIDDEEANRTLSEGLQQIDKGWHLFYSKYPQSQGILSLSRVGFNEETNQALVYVENVPSVMGGAGEYVLLVNKNGKWIIQSECITWVA